MRREGTAEPGGHDPSRYDRRSADQDIAIPPTPHDPPSPLESDLTGSDLDPSTDAARPPSDLSDAELDAKWGVPKADPLVGHGAPPVVAVMVTSDPGDWFDETLESLADQDYENLSVLVIDNAGENDPTARIAQVLPTAFVKRLTVDRGLSAAFNEALVSVEGAPFYLLLHDDVRLEPNAVTRLVSEAFRANAGIVGPKLVRWDDPTRLDSVGYSVDPYGFAASLSEPDELDQSQHDTAREVFAVSDACVLIRSDVFSLVGGMSEVIPYFGEDIDLCWRAHVAAATVQICPSAVVAHRHGFEDRRTAENRDRLQLRHQARTMLTAYEPFRLMRVVPVAFVMSLLDLLGSLVLGRFHRAGDIVAAWTWNLANLPSLFRARSRVKRTRHARDSEYTPLMRAGTARLSTLLRVDENDSRFAAAAEAGRGYLREFASGPSRFGTALAVFAFFLMLVGARKLITGPLPGFREFVDAGDSGGQLLSQWWTGWRDVGTGEAAIAPPVVPGLGLAGTLLFGSVGLARRLLILLPLLIGGIGAWKLFSWTGSVRARAGAVVVYGLSPVVLNAMAGGRLQALVVYAAAPWLLRRVAAAAGFEPFADESARVAPTLSRHLAGTALFLVAVGAVSPFGALVLVMSLIVIALAQIATGDRDRGLRVLRSAAGSAALASVVLSPWLLASARNGDLASFTGIWPTAAAVPSAVELITGSIGPVGVGLFGWGVIVAGTYSLLAARSWRWRWAVSGWALAFVSWTSTILLARADLIGGAGAALTLVPAVLGLAIAVAMGALTFAEDVIGSDFGAPQLLSGVAAIALLVSMVPLAVASADGRWYQPSGGFSQTLEVVDDGTDFRTLWIGDPDVLPLSGWRSDELDGLALGLSSGLDPDVTQRFRLDGGPGVEQLERAVAAALTGQTTRLGRLLAPMGVRYVIVVDRAAPQPFAPQEVPMPSTLVGALQEQLDLSEQELNAGLALFAVDDPWPLRADVTDSEVPADGAATLAEQLLRAPSEPPAVLGSEPGTKFSGSLDEGHDIAQSVTADSGWSLRSGQTDASRTDLFGWSQQFEDVAGGPSTLKWSTPWTLRLAQLVQVAALIALVVVASRRRRLVAAGSRRRRSRTAEEPVLVVSDDGEVTAGPGDETAGARS